MISDISTLLTEIRSCEICKDFLPLGPNPVLQVHPGAKILIAGQAPGAKVHETGIPFDDPSGERLRNWMGIGKSAFYDTRKIAILPMGFCYPGKGKSGDLPPRPECAKAWHEEVLEQLSQVELTLVIGKYAIDYHLGDKACKTLTETVKNRDRYLPDMLPLPHPSPRNNIWLKKNEWFEHEVLPKLKMCVANLI